MEISNLISELRRLNLPIGKYAVFGSAVMAVRGIRESPNIDVIVTNDLWHKLVEAHTPDEEGFIRIGNVKISNWWFVPTRKSLPAMIHEAEIIRGIPFVRIEEVKSYKSLLTGYKDRNDVKLIDQYLSDVSKNGEGPRGLGVRTYEKFLKIFVDKVNTQLGEGVLSLILFGSSCLGKANGNSDLDVFVFYDDKKINRNEVSYTLVKLILELRSHPEYQKLAKKKIYPEVYPFLISKSKAQDTLWVLLDATDHGIILKDTHGFGKGVLEKIRQKVSRLGGSRVQLGNGKWCWVLFKDFPQVTSGQINL
uniref:Polymerase nucleotidyl transferase domain-containing protein n=1 Tax=candidate division WWE3 bacterium TaxID=2053526 RepID=A0A831YTD0_UNCKA